MKRILITGEHSFIGTHIAAYLGEYPEEYVVETLSVHGHSPDEYDFHGADAVVHVAAIVHRKDSKKLQPLYDAVNRDLTAAIAGKAKREGVKQFVFFSSIGVYGQIEGVIDGNAALQPRTRYDRSKLQAEQSIAPLADDAFFVTILRAPVVFGPGAKGNPAKLDRLAKRLSICPDFENRRSMLSIETLCKTVKALLDAPRSGVFIPQERAPLSTCDLIAQSMKAQGKTPRKTKLLNPAIRALRRCSRIGKKAFGNLVYEGPFERALPATDGEETKADESACQRDHACIQV